MRNNAIKHIQLFFFLQHINAEAQRLLGTLRDEKVPKALRAANIRQYTVEWSGGRRDGLDPRTHANYLRSVNDGKSNARDWHFCIFHIFLA